MCVGGGGGGRGSKGWSKRDVKGRCWKTALL